MILSILLCWVAQGALIEYTILDKDYRLYWDFETGEVNMWKPFNKLLIIPNQVKQHWNNSYYNRYNNEPYKINDKYIEVEFFGSC